MIVGGTRGSTGVQGEKPLGRAWIKGAESGLVGPAPALVVKVCLLRNGWGSGFRVSAKGRGIKIKKPRYPNGYRGKRKLILVEVVILFLLLLILP